MLFAFWEEIEGVNIGDLDNVTYSNAMFNQANGRREFNENDFAIFRANEVDGPSFTRFQDRTSNALDQEKGPQQNGGAYGIPRTGTTDLLADGGASTPTRRSPEGGNPNLGSPNIYSPTESFIDQEIAHLQSLQAGASHDAIRQAAEGRRMRISARQAGLATAKSGGSAPEGTQPKGPHSRPKASTQPPGVDRQEVLSLGSSLQSVSSSPDGTHSVRSGSFGDRVEKDSWLPSRLSGDTYESFSERVMG